MLGVLLLSTGTLSAATPDFNNPQVIKRYAELVYNIATTISSHHDVLYNVPADKVSKCWQHGTKSQHAVGLTIRKFVFDHCYEPNGRRLPVLNGRVVIREINQDVSLVRSENFEMRFQRSNRGYTVNANLKVTRIGNNDPVLTNVDNALFTYNLRNETWEHTITHLVYSNSFPYTDKIETAENFSIALSGKPYGTLSAETIEPIALGTGNDHGQIISGKFSLLQGKNKAVITFIAPREILVERPGRKPMKVDWYGDPTIIYTKIPYELKH